MFVPIFGCSLQQHVPDLVDLIAHRRLRHAHPNSDLGLCQAVRQTVHHESVLRRREHAREDRLIDATAMLV
jgi:hypothetical protein